MSETSEQPTDTHVVSRHPFRRGSAGLMAAMALAATVPGGTPPTDNSRGFKGSSVVRRQRKERRESVRDERMAKAEAKRARRRARNLAAAPSQDGGTP